MEVHTPRKLRTLLRGRFFDDDSSQGLSQCRVLRQWMVHQTYLGGTYHGHALRPEDDTRSSRPAAGVPFEGKGYRSAFRLLPVPSCNRHFFGNDRFSKKRVPAAITLSRDSFAFSS